MTVYQKREARAPMPTSAHYPFYIALKEGRKVFRNDPLNDQKEELTLDHPGIQGNAANIVFYGYKDLSLESIPYDLFPMSSAPKDGTYILLFGDSGYTYTPFRCEVCHWDAIYRPLQPWVTYSNDSFLDSGGPPVGWLPSPNRRPIEKPKMEHDFFQIEDVKDNPDGLLFQWVVDGGLAICKTCGLIEGSLTTHCPGKQSHKEHGDAVYRGELDFVDGEWVKKSSPHSPAHYANR